MMFDLQISIQLSEDAALLEEKLNTFVEKELSLEDANLKLKITKDVLHVHISSNKKRSHEIALRAYKKLGGFFGNNKIGLRGITLDTYTIAVELEKIPKKDICIPYADIKIKKNILYITITNKGEEFLRHNYIDRIIKRILEKIDLQYYEGKKEYWNLIWQSGTKQNIWEKDPSEEMQRQGWIKLMGKGKWFYFPPAAHIFRVMEKIALQELIYPLGFKEIIQPMHVQFDTWLKTGHLEGMPGEIYYLSEPANREIEYWEKFVDILKIKKTVDDAELLKNLKPPKTGVCYAQCPNIYMALAGKTIAEDDLPLLLIDRSAPSNRYESGGKHGIERVDEFHRLELVYIGTKNNLFDLKKSLLKKYKQIFERILDLEWRMATVTPFYLQQAGLKEGDIDEEKGTIDFEAWLPYKGDRDKPWLEIQNVSIIGDKYTKSFNIKTQRGELWSGCSGIGLERWTIAFLSQKGMNPKLWPESFKKYALPFPEMPNFL